MAFMYMCVHCTQRAVNIFGFLMHIISVWNKRINSKEEEARLEKVNSSADMTIVFNGTSVNDRRIIIITAVFNVITTRNILEKSFSFLPVLKLICSKLFLTLW